MNPTHISALLKSNRLEEAIQLLEPKTFKEQVEDIIMMAGMINPSAVYMSDDFWNTLCCFMGADSCGECMGEHPYCCCGTILLFAITGGACCNPCIDSCSC